MRLVTAVTVFVVVLALSLAADAVGRNSPEQRALRSTVGIACARCGEHAVASAVYLGEGEFLSVYHCAEVEGAVVRLLIDDLSLVATVSRASAKHHLSLLEVIAEDIPLRPARVAPEPKLKLGTRVFVAGNPNAVPLVVFHGRVAKAAWAHGDGNNWPPTVMVLDVPASPGCSGGGVFLGRNGNLVGICAASNAEGNMAIAVGVEDIKAFLGEEE